MRLQRSALSVRAGLVAVTLLGFAGAGDSRAEIENETVSATAQELYEAVVGKMGFWECVDAWVEYREAVARGENPPKPHCADPLGPAPEAD